MKLPSLTRPVTEQDRAQLAAPALKPIRLILADEDLAGWVDPGGERISDLLQSGTELWFMPAGTDPLEWVPIEPSELLLVVPPPHVSPPERRMQRQLHEVFVRTGRYVASGMAHLRPGEERDPYLRSTRQFLPLTSATLAQDDGQAPEQVETLIVNLKRVDEFRVI